ncbi:hypothetical protein C6P40_002950 [Pichia californica]|uniref:GRIP domain-containing protein n=1 Tax=Pichia californica TaxID=460514 RepID=A0A9P7BF79_9ASCO|nr:hypothetical protein C6P42_002735 [[Candida] californica]KAG0687063.1 hypothetical protein C6P40_002950 [[Candida] californica]
MTKKKSKKNGAKQQSNGVSQEKVSREPTPESVEITEKIDSLEENGKPEQLVDTEVFEEKVDFSNEQIVLLQKQLEDLKLELSEKDSKISKIISENNEKDKEIILLKESPTPSNDSSNSQIETLKQQLANKTEESTKYKENYDTLLSRISQMKSVFSKMKESEAQFESLQTENAKLKSTLDSSSSKVSTLEAALTELKLEVSNLNSECDRLTSQNSELKKQVDNQDFELETEAKQLEIENKKLKRELKEAKSDLEEYLILIQEEKMSKTNLNQELIDFKTKIDTITAEKESSEKKCQQILLDVNRLKENIAQLERDNQEVISNSKSQLNSKTTQLNDFTNEINDLKNAIIEKDEKIKTIGELEKDLKDKQLLVGKLRHETITLNEHLTKAMKLIKRESSKETVDRELVSNLFISFLQLPRGDTKKFEVLQLIANFLDWDDEKKRHAGLLSSGNYRSNSNSVVEVPTPGRQSSVAQGDSFVSLWTEFLEKESTPKDQET